MARTIEEQEGARLPGARRLAAYAKAKTQGIVISDSLLAELSAL